MKMISRKEAQQAGATRYFTGEPCKHGHIAERFVSSRCCTECAALRSLEAYHADPAKAAAKVKARTPAQQEAARAAARAWKAANKTRVSEYEREKRAANPDAHKAALRAWRQANPEKIREAQSKWGFANRGKTNANAARAHAAKLQRTPAWADFKKIEDVYQDAREFRESGLEVDVDHVIPLQGELVSGLHVHQNLRVCLSSVNRSKSNTYQI
jgi:hypothetical protein